MEGDQNVLVAGHNPLDLLFLLCIAGVVLLSLYKVISTVLEVIHRSFAQLWYLWAGAFCVVVLTVVGLSILRVLLSVVDLTEIPLGRLFERVLNESVVYSATNRVVDNTVSWAASRILADAPAALLLGDGR